MNDIAPFFTEMEDYIRICRETIAVCEDVQLTGLDDRIDRLCNLVLALSPDERLQYEERLQTLLADLNSLGEEMRAQYVGVTELPKHRNASVAYKTADSRDNFGKRDEKE